MHDSNILIVLGLGFGDEGKGTVTDALVRKHRASAVVRWNGGPQAGHNVVAPDGRWHCFAQFGSGTFVPGVRTLLAPGMCVEPEALLVEASVLAQTGVPDALSRLTIDPGCSVVTPWHKMVNQLAEIARGPDRVGSCGMGVGETIRDRGRYDSLTIGDIMAGGPGFRAKMTALANRRFDEASDILKRHRSKALQERFDYFRERAAIGAMYGTYVDLARKLRGNVGDVTRTLRTLFAADKTVVFEGAQGALLDPRYGFSPHVTKSNTLFDGLRPLIAASAPERTASRRIGVFRAYGTRHGAGPFVTEDKTLEGILKDRRNATNAWQGRFRVGWLDLPALRYGIALNGGVDDAAITGLDRLSGFDAIRICTSYRYDGPSADVEPYFACIPCQDGSTCLTDFRLLNPPPDSGTFTAILARCVPLHWTVLPGWKKRVASIRRFDALPDAARALIRTLEHPVHLNVPIRTASVDPTAAGKIEVP